MDKRNSLSEALEKIGREIAAVLGEMRKLNDEKLAISAKCKNDDELLARGSEIAALSQEHRMLGSRFSRLKAQYDELASEIEALDKNAGHD